MKRNDLSNKNSVCYVIVLCIFLSLACAVKKSPICIKNGTNYGNTKTVFLDEWHDYYRRALSFIEGECYAFALSDLQEAVKIRFKDKAYARTYGMHFMNYFPHREMGYVFYKLGDETNAKNELEISLNQQFSDKAQYYLDKVRSSILKKKHRVIPGPEISIYPPFNKDEIWIKESPLVISASIKDPNYISRIIFADAPVFLLSSLQYIEFQKELYLSPGKNDINIFAENLAGVESKKSIVVHIDRSGPVIIINKVDWKNGMIFGNLDDETEDIQLWVEHNKTYHYKGRSIAFSIHFQKTKKTIKLYAKDRIGNQTIAFITPDNKSSDYLLMASSQSLLPFVSDTNPFLCQNKQEPEIILYGWNKTNTVYTNNVFINGFFKGNKTIDQLMINNKIITKNCQDRIFFNESIDLTEGDNTIMIQALSHQTGHTGFSDSIHIHRKIPEPYLNKYRIVLTISPIDLDISNEFETIQCDSQQTNFYESEIQLKCSKIKDFKNFFIKQLKKTNRFQIATISQVSDLKESSRLIACMNVFETKKDLEVFIRFIETETEHTFHIFDAYCEKKYSNLLKKLAMRLIEKIKKTYQLYEGQIVKVNNRIIEIDTIKNSFTINWPHIIFRKKTSLYNPVTGQALGSDSFVIGQATTKSLITNGCKAYIDEMKKTVIPGDYVIQK